MKKEIVIRHFLCFLLFCKIIDEVKLTITFEPKIRFEWDEKHMIEQNLLFHIKAILKSLLHT